MSSLPAVRLKIPCADAREFRERFVPRYVAQGVFVPSERPRPVGSRIHLKIELRDGSVGASGEALVTGHVQEPARRGMTLRLSRLDPGSLQFELSPMAGAGPAATPRPALAEDLFSDAPAAAAADKPLQVRTKTVKLKLAASPPPAAEHPPPSREPEEPEQIGTGDIVPAKEPVHPRVPRRGARRAVWVALGLAASVTAVLAGAILMQAREEARRAAFAEAIKRSDARVREGRLQGGGDSALDHLDAARAISPDDAGLLERLDLLADKMEELGERAARRGDARGAEAYYRAALRAEPGRQSARRRLAEIAGEPAAGR
jgi:hypothetical protein